MKNLLTLLNRTFQRFRSEKPILHASALSFITMFAVPPILIIIINSIGIVMGQDYASNKLYQNIDQLMGYRGAELFKEIISNYYAVDRNIGRTLLGIVFFIIASFSIFSMMQSSLNEIWKVQSSKKLSKQLLDKTHSIIIILSIIILFSLSLLLDGIMPFIKNYLNEQLPRFQFHVITFLKFLFSFSASVITFSVLFKMLPDVVLPRRINLKSSLITALFFAAGKGVITWSLLKFGIQNMYGTAGSVVVLLLWVFYSALIFYFGAHLCVVLTENEHINIQTKKNANRYEVNKFS